MSMTPLQAIAATKFVGGEGISSHRITTVMTDYAVNPLTSAIKYAIENVSYIDGDGSTVVYPLINAAQSFPEAAGIVRVGDRVTPVGGLDVPGFETTDDIKIAVTGYANHVLCNGDLGKFSSLVDKIGGLMTAVGDVTATIDKASTMQFSDFGPGVTNYSDALNMGTGAAATGIAESIKNANSGALPVIEGVPNTEAATVGSVLVAQGEVSGVPGSKDYGTALGIYEAAKKKGLTDSIDAIHQEFLKQEVVVPGKIPKTSGKYIRLAPTTVYTESDFNEMLDLTYAAAVEDETSTVEEERLEAATVKSWVESFRIRGYDDFMVIIRGFALEIMNDPDRFSANPFAIVTANLTVRSETHMKEAIDALSLDDAKKLFQGLGSKIQIEKLEKYTDILDIGKCSAAMPAPLTDTTAPTAIKSTAVAPVENPVTGKLDFVSLPVTQNLSVTGVTVPAIPTIDIPSASDIGAKALGIANNIKTSLVNFGESLPKIPSDMSAVGESFGQIKGFNNIKGTKSLGNMLRSVETSIPGLSGATSLLNNIKDVMPPEIKTELQAVVGVGSAAGGSYSLLDFVGSAVGENNQVANWQAVTQGCVTLWKQYESELSPLLADMVANASDSYDYTQFTDLLDNMYNSSVGQEVVAAYDDSINKIHAEYDRLINVASVDFTQLQSGDFTSKLNLSKKLAQHAHKLDSGHAAIFQSAADPTTTGGQALLGVMVEARNTKLLQNTGFNPVNSISKATSAAVTAEDTAEAAKIQATSGDPDAISAQQVANNRAINNALSGLFGAS